MTKRILYNFATRSRANAFVATVKSIIELSSSDNYMFVVKVDYDDPELLLYESYFDDYRKMAKLDMTLVIGESRSKIHAINRDIPMDVDWSILVNVSDDQRFTVNGFDDIIRGQCPDGLVFVHFPDSYKKAACSTMSIMSRGYYEQDGYVYNPAYYSLWCDVEATEVAKLRDHYKYVPKEIFKHIHFSNGGQMDPLYKRNNTYKADRRVYEKRRHNNFDLPFPRLPYLLIKYATRGRWRLFFQAIDNIYATIRTNQFKILVSADLDDVEMNSPEVKEWCRRYHNVELHFGDHKSKVEAINANFNPLTAWTWCVNMSDDMKFIVPGWDTKMLESIKSVWGESTDFFAHFNDNFVGQKLPTMSVLGREYYERFKYIYNPEYKSVSCDAEAMYVAQMLGRYCYFDEIYFSHDHPANLHEPSDHIYRRNDAAGKADTEVYFKRLKRKFDIDNPVMIPEKIKPYL